MRRWVTLLLLMALTPGLWAGSLDVATVPPVHAYENRNGSTYPAGYVDGYSLYNGYFVPNNQDPSGNMAECAEDGLSDIDLEAAFAYAMASDAADRGVFQNQASVLQSALIAYRYMGYPEAEAWNMALEWNQISEFSDPSSRDPMFFMSEDFELARYQMVNRARVADAIEQGRQARLELANLAFSMAVDDFSPLLMMGGGMAASAARSIGAVSMRPVMTAIMPGRGIWGFGSIGKAILRTVTTNDGFLFRGFTIRTPIAIQVQRFGGMGVKRADFWGLRIGKSRFANRFLAAIKPEWNNLSVYTKGVVPKGTELKIGIIGPQGWRWPGGSAQVIVKSKEVLNQVSEYIPR